MDLRKQVTLETAEGQQVENKDLELDQYMSSGFSTPKTGLCLNPEAEMVLEKIIASLWFCKIYFNGWLNTRTLSHLCLSFGKESLLGEGKNC